jgi:NADH-quinone oxidoreductase subunit N
MSTLFYDLSPEIVVLAVATLLLLVVAFTRDTKSQVAYVVAQLGILAAGVLCFLHMNEARAMLLNGQIVYSPLTSFLKMMVCILMFGGLIYARDYLTIRRIQTGEHYLLCLFAMLGMMLLISANNLLVFYLALELLSLPLYAIVALNRNSGIASEAAMKYFVMGALASGFVLYGISMLYGATQSLNLNIIAHHLELAQPSHHLIYIFGVVFVVVGLAFKLGAAPFHMWAPDVYHGASNPVTAIIASAPKIAVFAFFLRLLVDGAPVLHHQWHILLMVMAILSIILGNVIAVAQSNIKRMLAYSSIAHMGFIFLALLVNSQVGYSAALYYMITYAIMALGAFALLVLVSKTGVEIENIDDLRGLNERSPWLAFMMLLLMFSMAGVPPTVGFFAKWSVINALVESRLIWLAVLAVIFAVIGAYYYLRVIRVMYFESADVNTKIELQWDEQAALAINGLAVLYLGIFPAGLVSMCQYLLR